MRLVQFEIPGTGRRVGLVRDGLVADLTAVRPAWQRVVEVFAESSDTGIPFRDLLHSAANSPELPTLDYQQLLQSSPTTGDPFLHVPLDTVNPYRTLVSGTGLTHLGGMQARDQMHVTDDEESDEEQTDSRKMFDMGIKHGKPQPGQRGVAPEWFYKGNGLQLRSHRQSLEVHAHARDGGEEAEICGCYVVDREGVPRRIGFALGNEWSDHATEKLNYLYLAPSKLMPCAVGPELVLDHDFQEIAIRCSVRRNDDVIYDSGPLWSGEQHMCHSLANCEDHHFKYPQHRRPGDVHLHFFGTSKLSYGIREWQYADGDEICVTADAFSAPLVNTVHVSEPRGDDPFVVQAI